MVLFWYIIPRNQFWVGMTASSTVLWKYKDVCDSMPLQGLPSIRQKHIFSQTHTDEWVGKGKTARGSPVVPRSPFHQKQPAASKPGLSADVWALVKENTTWPQEEASAPQHRDFPGDLMLFVYPATAEGQSHLGGFVFFFSYFWSSRPPLPFCQCFALILVPTPIQ